MMNNHIDELKAKVAELQATIEAMEAESNKPKKFEWEYQASKTFFIGTNYMTSGNNGSVEDYIEHGRYRKTEEVAEQSLLRNKRANRLEALAEQLGGLKEFADGENNYYIYYYGGNYMYASNCNAFCPERVHMTKECAIEICRMFNEGEFSLDGENFDD